MPLIDALVKNSSLTFLDLAQSGLKWGGPNANGSSLIEQMASSAAALSSLKKFNVSNVSSFVVPVATLRASPEKGLNALRQHRFFTPGGPFREELFLMGDLMRKGNDPAYSEETKATVETVTKILGEARRGRLNKDAWEASLTQLIADGYMRRGHLSSLVNAEALRDVGFSVIELIASAFSLHELRLGGFTAAEMKASGRKAAELGVVGYTAAQLKKGGYAASCKDLTAVHSY